ncbi:MAG: DUF2461 domain-containing protein [Bacteroidales bacterium]|nr:DUF2461 domain-containing protein [Bacteroidales bacterium]MBN2820807.1 DUF2461 domain-containing protein [Bacteroidales bacterium]
MINALLYRFLTDLSKNNNKEWFQENRKTYNTCRESFIYSVELMIRGISEFDKSIAGLQPKNCIFRINRDIRFSNDKRPYKTNFGAFMAPGGRNSGKGGYYLHIEPGLSMIAGGIYMPSGPVLKTIRNEVYNNLEEFESIVTEEDFVKHFSGLTGEKLKTKPQGFPDDFEGMEYLRFKHYIVSRNISDKQTQSPEFFNELMMYFESIYPLNRFLNQAVAELS